jgi:hypothetical protein
MENDYISFLRSALEQEELVKLNFANQEKDLDARSMLLRGFFNRPEIFNKIKVVVDPSWLCSKIIIKGKGYEF